MVNFSAIQQEIDKLLLDEIFYALFNTDEDTKSKAYCLLTHIKIYKDLINNNFLELQKSNFFNSESEENKFKSLSGSMQIFYYLLFKKYS